MLRVSILSIEGDGLSNSLIQSISKFLVELIVIGLTGGNDKLCQEILKMPPPTNLEPAVFPFTTTCIFVVVVY